MTSTPLFGPDFLTRLEYLALAARRAFRGALLAQRRSTVLGSGIEFAEHREYTAADDYRYLDWNVYARHDELLVKRFEEEEDLHVYLLLDCSKSMAAGSPCKFDLARQVAAALAYLALADLDRVAVLAVAGDVVDEFPLTRGKDRILSLLQFLERLPARGARTDLARAARTFVHRARRRGLAILVSDLFDQDGFEPALDLLRHHRYEVQVVQVYDRAEAEPAFFGDVELVNVETDAGRKVTVTEHALRRYRELFGQMLEAVRRYCRRHSLGCTQARTGVAFDDLVLQLIRSGGVVQ
jgi:uncharacterized protein (DUF58 family)